MAIYDDEEVVAFRVGSQVVCSDCLTAEEQKHLTEDSIVIQKEVEEKYAFCDRCKESLN